MAYSKASGKAVLKYDKTHYKKVTVKIPLDVWDNVQKCGRFKNANQFINMLIREELERDGFLSEWDVVLNTMCNGVDKLALYHFNVLTL